MLLKIFKDILQSSTALGEIDIQICCYLLHTIAKLTYQNSIFNFKLLTVINF